MRSDLDARRRGGRLAQLAPLRNLARLRLECDLSQAELANRIDCSARHLRRLEAGRAPTSEFVIAIAGVLGFAPEVLSAERIDVSIWGGAFVVVPLARERLNQEIEC